MDKKIGNLGVLALAKIPNLSGPLTADIAKAYLIS